MVDATAWSPIKGSIGIGMSLFSYNGRIRASIVTDSVVMTDSQDTLNLIKAFEEEVTDLAESCNLTKESLFLNSN